MRALLLLSLLTLAACDTTGREPDFGAAYAVNAASLDGTSLQATVAYSGGCEDHTFRAESRRSGDRVEVWLVHEGTPDVCEAYPSQILALSVPPVAEAASVWLLTPSDGPIVLR